MMFCSGCNEDVRDQDIVYDDDIVAYCDCCWPAKQKSVETRKARHAELGHTGSDMCGCSMCAARFESDHA